MAELTDKQLHQVLANKRKATKVVLAEKPPVGKAMEKVRVASARVAASPPTETERDVTVGIPPRFRPYRLTPEHWPSALLSLVEPWLEDRQSWSLYLHGPTDARKTTFAAAVLMDLRARDRRSGGSQGLFLPAYKAVGVFRNIHDENQRELIRQYARTPWLVLDDLGKHRDTPHVIEQMLMLLHERYDWHDPERMTKTILTANMDLDELAKRIDGATARRLAEGLVVQMTVPSVQQ